MKCKYDEFRDAFEKIMGAPPTKKDQQHNILKAYWIDTKLGPMIAISTEEKLVLLAFIDKPGLEREIQRLRVQMKSIIIPGKTKPIISIESELHLYFDGALKQFKTPTHLLGTPFQKRVWEELIKIPYGSTKSYLEQSRAIGNEKAYRAVANANGANQLALIIPCHRIIKSTGDLGGYAGGISRKQWLLDFERGPLCKK